MAGVNVETVAKAMNVTPRRVQQMVKEGMPKGAARGEYDLGACLIWYVRYLQAALERGAQGAAGVSAEERNRLSRAQAERAELELSARRGAVVDRGRMERAMAAVLVTVRFEVTFAQLTSKEAIAPYDEIIKEIRLGVMEVGRRLGIHIRKEWQAAERTIWMDGRARPPEYAGHSWQGFSLGKWEGDVMFLLQTGAVTGSMAAILETADDGSGTGARTVTFADGTAAFTGVSAANKIEAKYVDRKALGTHVKFTGTVTTGPILIGLSMAGVLKNQ